VTYEPTSKVLETTGWRDLSLVAASGLHSYFPFDDASFDFNLQLDPPLTYHQIFVYNHVPGFVIDCSDFRVRRKEDGTVDISFVLQRSPLVGVMAISLAIASVVFMLFILRLNNVESLATSVASFFFSMWSLRGIFSSEMRVFPTLFDFWLLLVCMMMLVLLCLKAVTARAKPLG